MDTPVRTLKIFVSSPGDVEEERFIAERVLMRLGDQFARVLKIEPVFWEHEPQLATQSFQEGIPSPADMDIVVCILWARIGTRLPPRFTAPTARRTPRAPSTNSRSPPKGIAGGGCPTFSSTARRSRPIPRPGTPRISATSPTSGRRWNRSSISGFTVKVERRVAAFNPFQQPADFEQILEMHLRRLIEKRLDAWGIRADVGLAPPRPSWTEGSPFRGLEVFEFEHAPIFFGRTRAVSEVLAALRRQAQLGRAFLMILGSSGCGKSSLVCAGVLPMLTQPGVIEGVGLWRRAILRPSAVSAASRAVAGSAAAGSEAHAGDNAGDLFDALASALVEPAALPELLADGTSAAQVAGMLRKNPAGDIRTGERGPLGSGGTRQAGAGGENAARCAACAGDRPVGRDLLRQAVHERGAGEPGHCPFRPCAAARSG